LWSDIRASSRDIQHVAVNKDNLAATSSLVAVQDGLDSTSKVARLRRRMGRQSVRSDIRPGGTFSSDVLPDQTNTVRKLSVPQGNDPPVLTDADLDNSGWEDAAWVCGAFAWCLRSTEGWGKG
jgi:hypothetical protein